ncbi:hydroxyethylthiazole kinase [Sphingobacterium paludis]|jgi:hydroxyethylthiazole kinase|uniref:Hydroxyethylthiazole kinase n=1 Tax=Sphingobacterium paludis TaxID=1476465 RepID=A0A4R7CXH6_9SPHI|nr:hydroxyethylthiazole kinase [Sphingobacterium paludis]TDS11785.1 hydroxyethylthiazole kinase [Sphingobacterium paludis]
MEQQIIQQLHQLRQQSPLVHNITNFVVMNNTANALLAIGASPVMVHSSREVKDVVTISGALVINIGTLSEEWADAMLIAAKHAAQIGCPWVLDPVGAGISPFRNEVLKELLDHRPTAIRGNASEIIALASFAQTGGKGVDSIARSADAVSSGKVLQEKYGAQVCISGETDYVIGKDSWAEVNNGSILMTKVTGLGCTASALVAAFLALRQDPFAEALAGVSLCSLAGELAARQSIGPGTLQLNLYDTLHNLSDDEIRIHLNVKEHAY